MIFDRENWRSLKPRETSYLCKDALTVGLYCQVSPKGAHSWVVKWSPEPYKQAQVAFSACEDLSIAKARDYVQRVRMGLEDPRTLSPKNVKPSPKEEPKVLTYAEAIEDFLAKYPHESKDEERNKRTNCKRIVAAFGPLPVQPGITEKQVVDFLDAILEEPARPNRPDKPKKATRNAVLRTLNRFFKWGRSRYALGSNPCADIEYLSIKGRKERLYLEDLELLGAALKKSQDPYKWGVIIPLLVGGRIGSMENIEQGRYDSVKRRYEFQDVEGTKDLDYLYASPHMLWCLQQLPRVSPALIRTAWETIREEAGFDRRITRHDFRRTFKSLGSDIGEDHIKLETLIGHSLGGVTAIYHHNDWQVLGEVNDRMSAAIWKAMKLPPLAKVKLTKK